MTDQTSPATELSVCAIRTRYRSDPGMIGHYPWSYSDKLRGKREYIEDRYDIEELTPKAPAQATIDVLRAEVERLKADAARYRALRHSLSNEASCSHTRMPLITDPLYGSMVTYLPHGLDQALDAIIAERALNATTPQDKEQP